MRAAVVTDERQLAVAEVPEPDLAPGDVRVRVAFSGICGSDLHLLHDPLVAAGHVLGHEFSGEVVETGEAVDPQWAPGDRVAVMPLIPCGACDGCLAGDCICLPGILRGPGIGSWGGFAQTVAVPEGMLRRLPDGMTLEAGALVEPLAVAIRGIKRGRCRADSRIVVLGAGPIGFMVAAALLAKGLRDVIVVDPNRSRLEQVSRLGVIGLVPAEAVNECLDRFSGHLPHLVLDCTGHPSGPPLAIQLAAAGGVVVVLGVPVVDVAVSFQAIASKELLIRGSLAYDNDDFAEAISLLADGAVLVSDVVTSIVGLDEVEALVQDLSGGGSTHVKVLVRPTPA